MKSVLLSENTQTKLREKKKLAQQKLIETFKVFLYKHKEQISLLIVLLLLLLLLFTALIQPRNKAIKKKSV